MKLDHAVKVAMRAAGSDEPLTTEQKVAVEVLLTLARRVTKAKGPMRDVVKALYGDDLNQADLFGEEPEK